MKKRLIYLISLVILIGIAIVWRMCLTASGFQEWGIYLFSVPVIYCFAACLLKEPVKPLRIIIPAFIGVVIALLLSRDVFHSFFLQKMAMTFLGSMLAYLFLRK